MIVEQQSLIGFAFAFCKDNWCAVCVHYFGGEAARTQHIGNEAGTFLQANTLGTDAGLCHKF